MKFGATLIIVRGQVEILSPMGTKDLGAGGLRKTPDLEKAFEYAAQEATKLGDKTICPVHLLLGMMRIPKSQVVEILEGLDIDLGELRKTAVKVYKAKLFKKQRGEVSS